MIQPENNNLAYFYGRSNHKLNAKSQVAIPSRFRAMISEEDLKQGLVLIRGEGKCIYCYTHSQFRKIVDEVMTNDETRDDAEFLRNFFEETFAVDLDSQGRVVLPVDLRNQADMTSKEIVFIGHNDRIEIWDAEIRNTNKEKSKTNFDKKRSITARKIFGP